MSRQPGPHDGGTEPVIFAPSGRATVKSFSPSFYQDLGNEFPDFSGHVLVQRFGFDTAWSNWERHPHGDEYVYLLSGDVDFVLWQDGREAVTRVDKPGTYVIVPQNTWHTARPHAPTEMLFITPGKGTDHTDNPA